MITRAEWERVVRRLTELGFCPSDIEWSEALQPPIDPVEFAQELIFVICNSGMKNTVARGIYERVRGALAAGRSARTSFGHRGKADAIDVIWAGRHSMLLDYAMAADKVAWLRGVPWIGPITCYHAAKNFGVDVVKPDVHLQRLADHHRCTPTELCAALASQTGYRLATIDTVLWRACANGVIHSPTGEIRA